MLTEFGKIFIFMLTAVLFTVVAIFVARLIRPSRPSFEKLLTYECGEDIIGSPWVKFNIRFYVVALIFLIFDVEVVLLIPWALVYQNYGVAGYMVGFVFLVLLGLGMAYEWRKGDLEWERQPIPTLSLKKRTEKDATNLEGKQIKEEVLT